MSSPYSISDFYLLLKLGIFRGGKVGNWGEVSLYREQHLPLRKPVDSYRNIGFPKAILGAGIYLLDFYLLEKKSEKTGIYILIISINRNYPEKNEQLYVLRLNSEHSLLDIKTGIMEGTDTRNPNSFLNRWKPKTRMFERPDQSFRTRFSGNILR